MHHLSAGGVALEATAEPRAAHEWLRDSVRSSLVLVFAGAAVAFALFAAVGQLLPRPGVEWIPAVDGATAVVLAVGAVVLARRHPNLLQLHIVGYGFAAYCIAHGIAASAMSGTPGDVTFAALLTVGIGAVAVFWWPSLALIAAAATSTMLAAGLLGGAEWLLSSTVLMASSTLVGVTILSARRRAFDQIDTLREADQRRGRELASAVAQLELELAERHRAEAERAAVEARLAQVQSLDALGTLAGGVAHGMNNVLAVISGVAELGASESAPDSQARADFERILEASGRGTDLMRNLLGFARRGKVRHASFALDEVVREVVDGLASTTPDGVRFVLELERVTVVGDPGQLSQAVLNICLNAVEAVGASGTVRLRLTSAPDAPGEGEPREPGGRSAVLEITDDGSGMDEDAVAHAFQPFYASRSADSGRHGLGLAMVFGSVRDHGGEVTLRSAVGVGTTVLIRLPEVPGGSSGRASTADDGQDAPAQDVPDAPDAPASGAPSAGSPSAGSDGTATEAGRPASPTILIVDDEPYVRRLVARMLELACHRCETADGGRAAVERVGAAPGVFGLVILDVAMPGMDGAATFEAIRTLDPALPILLASGYPKDRRIEDLLALGRADFLSKPFLREQLVATAERILRAVPAADPPA